ncbi:dexamethasone-induced Ras-related protein 1 isoform X2 [Globicephala melas]|uniref:dexamethasone-induced Ras-related protein 1 isoform X2 n=1 Tax=Globicephala melas TaxID=9731 RepID=UPI003872D152
MKLAAMIKKMCQSDSELSIPAKNCYRMVVLGSSKVGKTAIVSRFLTGRFEDAYTPTIEDFHRKFYCIRGEIYQLDILDTSGNHPFPAMRRLSILTDPRHQILPQEQNQGERGRAPGHLWQQRGPGLLPRGGAARDRAAGGRRPPALRLLRDLGQEEQPPGPDVPRALRHGQPAARDEPGPAPPGIGAALRGAAQEGAAGQEAAASGRRPGRRLRHLGALGAQAKRAQRSHVHPREGQRRRPDQGQGTLRYQLGTPAPRGRRASEDPLVQESSVRAVRPEPRARERGRASSFPALQPVHWGDSKKPRRDHYLLRKERELAEPGLPPRPIPRRRPLAPPAQQRLNLPCFSQRPKNGGGNGS